MPFKSFLKRVNTNLLSQSLKDASFSLKTNKSPGADKINFNVIKHCFEELCGPFTLHKKRSFLLRISSVNVPKSAGIYGFGHIY